MYNTYLVMYSCTRVPVMYSSTCYMSMYSCTRVLILLVLPKGTACYSFCVCIVILFSLEYDTVYSRIQKNVLRAFTFTYLM